MELEWPLQGRSGELRRLTQLLLGHAGGAVVLAGAPGVGKTRLAREYLQLAADAGHETVWIAATRSAMGLPFGALASALPPLPSDAADAAANRSEFLRLAMAAMLDRAGHRPLTLVVDDAHLLDEASAMLIHQFTVSGSASVVLTVRATDPAPDLVTALWKEELATRIDVPALESTAIEELLTAVLGGPLDPAVRAHLTVQCQGNVLLLREIILAALADGALVDQDGLWRLVRPVTPSARLVEFVQIRLDALSSAERSLLEVVSYGEPLGGAELKAFDGEQVALALERKGFVKSSLNGRRLEVRLRHPIYGDVLRNTMPMLRIRQIALRLAEAVESTGARRREDALRTMVWRLDAGGGDPHSMLEAARIARWRYDFELAEKLVRAALSEGAGFDAQLLFGQLLALRGDAAAAERHLAGVTAPNDAARAQLAIARVDNMVFSLGRPERGLEIAEEAEATVSDPAAEDEIAAHHTGVVISTQGPAAGAEAAVPILERASGRALVWASMPAAVGLSRLGRIDEAIAAVDTGSTAHQALAEPMDWYPWFHHFLRCVALNAAGDYVAATELARRLHSEGIDEHSLEKRAVFAWHLTTSTEDRGNPSDAIRFGREAVALFRELGRKSFVQSVLPSLAIALALGGRPDEAREVLDAPELRSPGQPLWTPAYLPLARAWCSTSCGDQRSGRAQFLEAADSSEEVGDLVGTATALHAIARTGDPRAVAERLEDLASRLRGPIIAARSAHCRALVDRDVEALTAVADSFTTIGAHLLAAEAAADIALLHRRAGHARAATAAARRAATLARVCGHPATPALLPARSRAELTPAEQETATLAAAGYSSKQIAERLVLSARTVDNRLRRVYAKLGITSRAQLDNALDDRVSG